MVCIPGRIHEAYTDKEYAKYKSPTGADTNNQHCWIDCEFCGISLAAGSYQSHLETQQNVFQSMVLQQEIVVKRSPVIYRAIKLTAVGKYICLVLRCGGKASTKWNFQ